MMARLQLQKLSMLLLRNQKLRKKRKLSLNKSQQSLLDLLRILKSLKAPSNQAYDPIADAPFY
jgi:hypothetical protein